MNEHIIDGIEVSSEQLLIDNNGYIYLYQCIKLVHERDNFECHGELLSCIRSYDRIGIRTDE